MDASLLYGTVFIPLASKVAAIRVPASVLTDKAKVPTFLLLCRRCSPGVTQVVPKMKAHLHLLTLDMDDADLLIGWGEGCP